YILQDILGYGSMGTVYKALSRNDQQHYALKVLPRRSMWNVILAKRQVQTFKKIQHPSVVACLDVGTAGSQHHLAWSFVEGETLDKIVQRDSKLHAGIVAHYALQMAEALRDCHLQGLFHGLLKPSNLLIDARHQAYILDFGVGAILTQNEDEQSM